MFKYSIATLLLGITGIALAQQQMPAFEDVDANSDGQISREEAATVEGLDFAAHDANQDGALSREEYESTPGE